MLALYLRTVEAFKLNANAMMLVMLGLCLGTLAACNAGGAGVSHFGHQKRPSEMWIQ